MNRRQFLGFSSALVGSATLPLSLANTSTESTRFKLLLSREFEKLPHNEEFKNVVTGVESIYMFDDPILFAKELVDLSKNELDMAVGISGWIDTKLIQDALCELGSDLVIQKQLTIKQPRKAERQAYVWKIA